MKKIILLIVGYILLTFIYASLGLAQVNAVHEPTITPLWTWQLSSDFGPRIKPTDDASWFHKGIDFPATAGTGINPVENGTIVAIRYVGGWYVAVQGVLGRWTYLHIFNGAENDPLPRTSGNWELTENVTLVDPDTGDSGWARVIIYWIDKAHYRAEKVLCEQGYEDSRVLLDGHTLVYGNGSEVRSQSTVGRAATIAPVGTSGVGTGAHLHLSLAQGNDNPFYHLVHKYPADPLPRITSIDFPIPGNEIPKSQICDEYHIWVLINSEGGYDLDKVDFWVYPNNDPAQAIHLPQGTDTAPTFRYGGRTEPGEDVSTSAKTESTGDNTGVEPLPGFGLDEFVYMQKFPSLNLSAGEHTLAVRATDVNGHATDTVTSRFIINGDIDVTRTLTPPAVTTVAPGGTLGPFTTTETNNGGAAQQFSVQWYIVQPDGAATWLPSQSADVPACQTLTHEHVFPIPSTSGPGDFILGILATDANGNQFDYDYFTFTVTAAQ